ncbi:MAG TPA: von Willebrand factor type A domain-containing protein [Planctomycetota bacterium]
MNCLTSDTLERLALGFLEDERSARAHVAACAACAKRLTALDADHAALSAAAKDVAIPPVRRPAAFNWKPWAAAALALTMAGGVLIFQGAAKSPPAPAVAEYDAAEYEYLAHAGRTKSKKAAPTMDYARSVDDPMVARAPAPPPVLAPKPEPAKPAPRPLAVTKAPMKGEPAPELPEAPATMIFKDAGWHGDVDTAKETQSTFGLDVDTASYTLMRSYLQRGLLPPAESVRVEEYVNYFRYPDPAPKDNSFLIRLEAAPSPFAKGRHLLRIGLRSKEVADADRKDAVLTFVIDVSGSMQQENRLELVKKSLRHLVDRLRPSDRVALVVYGSSAHEILPHTPLAEKATVQNAIDALRTEGSTNVEDGLRYGYRRASLGFDKTKTNRVILCSDGVANNGVTDPDVLLTEVKKHAGDSIYLTTIGFGMGNVNDHLMERLADGGNGNYAYVDDFAEAKKMFGAKLTSMMDVLAADAKVQVEFDPATVAMFRQIGYENRRLANQDFRNDKVDAGEVGMGHQVTALYEIELKPDAPGRLVTVRLRYREPDTKEVVELQESTGRAQVKAAWTEASPQWRLAASVAAFAEILKGNPARRGVSLDAVAETVEQAVKELDRPEDAVEFLGLVKKAAALKK